MKVEIFFKNYNLKVRCYRDVLELKTEELGCFHYLKISYSYNGHGVDDYISLNDILSIRKTYGLSDEQEVHEGDERGTKDEA